MTSSASEQAREVLYRFLSSPYSNLQNPLLIFYFKPHFYHWTDTETHSCTETTLVSLLPRPRPKCKCGINIQSDQFYFDYFSRIFYRKWQDLEPSLKLINKIVKNWYLKQAFYNPPSKFLPRFYVYLCIGVIRIPGGSKWFLASEVPHDEVDVLPDDLLHVRPDRRRRLHHLVHEELVEDCRFAGIV